MGNVFTAEQPSDAKTTLMFDGLDATVTGSRFRSATTLTGSIAKAIVSDRHCRFASVHHRSKVRGYS
jgi:hypothetical protein